MSALKEYVPERVPLCPACGAKFSHSLEQMACKTCGLPDEIRGAGESAITAWKRGKLGERSKPAIEFRRPGTAGSRHRKKRKHGRRT